MALEFSLNLPRTLLLALASVTLAVLFFMAGWFSALIYVQWNQPRIVRQYTPLPPKQKEKPPAPKPAVEQAEASGPTDYENRQKILESLLEFQGQAPRIKENGPGFTVLSDGFWNHRTKAGLIRSVPAAGKQALAPEPVRYYSVVVGLYSQEAEAGDRLQLLKEMGEKEAYGLRLFTSDGQTGYALFLGDYTDPEAAKIRARDFKDPNKEQSAFVCYVPLLSQKPLARYAFPFPGDRTLPRYAIRLATYYSQNAAQAGLPKYEKNGLKVYLVRDGRRKRPLWIVYLGQYQERSQAKQALRKHRRAIQKATRRKDARVEKIPEKGWEKLTIVSALNRQAT